ncbi:carbohydrate sulfotransferase 14 [Lepeophtheirus salmonis]|uniref:carbohydrate sulfotransferase 14 n=1 Tax=Lepeophtheirus salmonis TaxID=72036 RepID=UPI001AE2F74B|nr:carbohydrate sulfotransferase 14-like [Lepeophtheirus salmonis]
MNLLRLISFSIYMTQSFSLDPISILNRFEERNHLYQRICEKYNSTRRLEFKSLYEDFHFDRTLQSLSGKFSFCIAEDGGKEDLISSMIPSFDLKHKDKKLIHKKKKVLVVVHPLIRILSAYINFFVKGVSHQILSMKLKTYWSKDKSTLVTIDSSGLETLSFKEFVAFLTECGYEYSESLLWMADGFAEPWTPLWYVCDVCKKKYDYIVHMETIHADFDSLIHRQFYRNEKEVIEKVQRFYYSQLTQRDLIKLYQKYKLDFDLFGYTLEPFWTWAEDPCINPE